MRTKYQSQPQPVERNWISCRTRRRFIKDAALAGISVGFAAYPWLRIGPAMAQRAGGTLRIAQSVPRSLSEPHKARSWRVSNIVRQVCSSLTRIGSDGVTKPDLIEGWEVENTFRTWTLHLRKVKWHSGRPFTADDVIWNLKRIHDVNADDDDCCDPDDPDDPDCDEGKDDCPPDKVPISPAFVEKIDDHTLKIDLPAPRRFVPELLADDRHLILDPKDDGTFKPGSNGTGPFRFVDYTDDNIAVLKRFDNYWGNKPSLDEVIFRHGIVDQALLLALGSQDINMALDIDLSKINEFSIPELTIQSTPGPRAVELEMNVKHEFFEKFLVRKAFRVGIDTGTLVQNVLHGYGAAGKQHVVPPFHPAFANFEAVNQNLGACRKLLAEAGYPNGLKVTAACPSEPSFLRESLSIMREQYKGCGIELSIQIMERSEFWSKYVNGKLEAPLAMVIWNYDSPVHVTLQERFKTEGRWNKSGFSDDLIDTLIDNAATANDRETYNTVLRKIGEEMMEKGPIVRAFWLPSLAVTTEKVRGFTPHPRRSLFAEEIWLTS